MNERNQLLWLSMAVWIGGVTADQWSLWVPLLMQWLFIIAAIMVAKPRKRGPKK